MSILGSALLLSYFIWGKNDSVGVLSNLFPMSRRALQPVPRHARRVAKSAMAEPQSEAPRRSDYLWLLLALVVLVATGIGTRAPWPADEPRFTLIARDMVATGDWLIPRVGGNLYQEKPPFFFWLLALRRKRWECRSCCRR